MTAPPPPHLSPADLFQGQATLDEQRRKVYDKILAIVHQRIRHTSSLQNTAHMTNYDVPEWQPGCPRYDVKDCILYLVWNLRASGFQVLYVSPNRLLISWVSHANQYYQEESPIRQAMVAAVEQGKTAAPAVTSKEPKKKTAQNYKPTNEGVAALLADGAAGSKKPKGNTITFI